MLENYSRSAKTCEYMYPFRAIGQAEKGFMNTSDAKYRSFLRIYLLVSAALVVFLGYLCVWHDDPWAVGDWLINYSGGFVRRGLLGECLLLMSHLLHANLLVLLLLLQLTCYAVIFSLIWVMLRDLSWSLWMILIVYSPATVSLTLLNPGAAYKKEILLFPLLLSAALLPENFRLNGKTGWLLIPACAFLLFLTHEGVAAFFPYFFAIYLIKLGSIRSGILNFIPAALAGGGALVLATRHHGDVVAASQICSSIGGVDLSSPVCSGGITYLTHDLNYARAEMPEWIHYWHLSYVTPYLMVLALIPFLMGLAKLWPVRRFECRCLAACSLLAWLASISLFVYAKDWYRWIYIHSFCSMVVLLLIERRRQMSQGVSEVSWSLPKKPPLRYATICFVAFMTVGWQCAFTHHFPMPLDSVAVFYRREVMFIVRHPATLRTFPQRSDVVVQ